MVQVTLQLNKSYTEELAKRLKKLGVSQAALAREMGASATQVTRWFTKNEKRRVMPELETVRRIEQAMARLEKGKGKTG